jgi:hypothetical protein
LGPGGFFLMAALCAVATPLALTLKSEQKKNSSA